MRHFGTIGKKTILNKSFGITNASKNTREYSNYLKRPLVSEFSRRSSDVARMKRKFKFNYNDLGWCNQLFVAYNRFLQGIFDSYLCFNSAANGAPRTIDEVTTGFVETLRGTLLEQGGSIDIVRFSSTPEFLNIIPESSHPQTALEDDQCGTSINHGTVKFIHINFSTRRRPNSDTATHNFMTQLINSEAGPRDNPASLDFGDLNSAKVFAICKPVDNYKIFQVDPITLGVSPTCSQWTSDDNLSEGGPSHVRNISLEEGKIFQYIAADLPPDYDANYNSQEWLPLTNTDSSFFLDPTNTQFVRYSHPVWEISNIGPPSPGSFYTDCSTNFIGNWHSDVKNCLFSYEFSEDPEDAGKGKVYVDKDSVCYCPLSGYPLKCVYRSVDYQDMQSRLI